MVPSKCCSSSWKNFEILDDLKRKQIYRVDIPKPVSGEHVTFEHVTFDYDKSKPLIKDLNVK